MPTVTDWFMVVITLVYVIATIAIWRANNKSANATEKQLKESRWQFIEAQRLQYLPYLEILVTRNATDFLDADLSLVISSHRANEATATDLQIKIKNIGLGAAKNIQYLWTNMDGSYLRKDLPFTACLPGEEKDILVDFCFKHPEDLSPYEATVRFQFQYKDMLENQYHQDLSLTFQVNGPDQVKLTKHIIGVPNLIEKN